MIVMVVDGGGFSIVFSFMLPLPFRLVFCFFKGMFCMVPYEGTEALFLFPPG